MTREKQDQLEKALKSEQARSERLKKTLDDIALDLEHLSVEGHEASVKAMRREIADAIKTYDDLKERFGV